MDNILSKYKNKAVSKELAVSIAIKFAKQECILYDFLKEIKNIKPYKKGNDDIKFMFIYAVSLSESSYSSRSLCDLFLLPLRNWVMDTDNFIDFEKRKKWKNISSKWQKTIGELKIRTFD